MSKADIIKPYKKEHEISYVSGAYATIEILKIKPGLVRRVFIHSAYTGRRGLEEKCNKIGIPVVFGDAAFRRVNQKENAYVLAVFGKYACTLDPGRPHIVLANPADMGNLGTILRTMAGFNLTNLAIITPAADIFDPKTIRASMGALFHISFELFGTFDAYRRKYPCHLCYPFMLNGAELPGVLARNCSPLFSLIFGNEATGLGPEYASAGSAVRIPQSAAVDSLNVSVAAGIGMYAFAGKYHLI